MSEYLCISVTFLDPLFHGKGDDAPEWPPSPMRLFQALVAGARTGCRGNQWSEAKAEAFRWLERQRPPIIIAPKAQLTAGRIFFVPDNVGDAPGQFDRENRLIGKAARPCHLVDGDTLYYLWPLDNNDGSAAQQHAEVLCREARHLLALGWGIDQVVGNGRILSEADIAVLPGQRWRPWDTHRSGEQTWRIPMPGSLDRLGQVYQSFLRRVDLKQYRPPLRFIRFQTVHYFRDNTLPPRSYAAFELPEGVAFRQEIVAKVAAMLRSAAIRGTENDPHQFPGGPETYVAGHVGQEQETPPRFSYLPLPTIRDGHADGMIRRLLIAEPFGGDGTHARWAQNRLSNTILRDKYRVERGLLLGLWRPASKGMVKRYVRPAIAWATVTPVILQGFDDGKLAKAEKLLFTAIKQAGLPLEAVKEVTMRKAPFWPGSQHPRHYFLPNYLTGRPGWHVRMIFYEPMPGPLAIGAGRHIGLGLFAGSEE